jgi:hypothetical protein
MKLDIVMPDGSEVTVTAWAVVVTPEDDQSLKLSFDGSPHTLTSPLPTSINEEPV